MMIGCTFFTRLYVVYCRNLADSYVVVFWKNDTHDLKVKLYGSEEVKIQKWIVGLANLKLVISYYLNLHYFCEY